MQTLSIDHRRQLERAVTDARDIAESGAQAALEALAVDRRDPFEHMADDQRVLRRRLRVHARHLGDRADARPGTHKIDHLIQECAYEHWHAMLFARFLSQNDLLIEPDLGVPVTLDECEELAKEEGTDRWTLASRFAQRMLPQVFRPKHPVFGVRLAREHRMKLEELVEGLVPEVFTASDALGWVYQFWQARKKDEVNRSEVKIGADELPAVTQLFTEPYMVQFLLDNSLGAWWASRHPDKPCPVELAYLRIAEDGVPAAGSFAGWPDELAEFRLLDPCCGSGHFLVAALLMLVPMRMALEGLDASTAVAAVLEQNIHGLEIDRRCVAIAAFALALEAWRYPGAGGHRRLPRINLAWCGQPLVGNEDEWLSLGAGDAKVAAGMAALRKSFRDAPILGSLIDPRRIAPEDLLTAGFEELQPLLERVLREHAGEEELEETAIAALGVAEAVDILSDRFHLVITNVPYLARGKQADALRRFCEMHYGRAKNDLANVFLERCLELAAGGEVGHVQVVMPQSWIALPRYMAQREALLNGAQWKLLARLGTGAFETITGEVVNVMLLTLRRGSPPYGHSVYGINASEPRNAEGKARALVLVELAAVEQASALVREDLRLIFDDTAEDQLLVRRAHSRTGTRTADNPQFLHLFWEHNRLPSIWVYEQSTPRTTTTWSGRDKVLLWEGGVGKLEAYRRAGLASVQGRDVWERQGVCVSLMGDLPATLYAGQVFDMNAGVICPATPDDLPSLWMYLSSAEYAKEVRKLVGEQLKLTTRTLLQVPFDVGRWRRIAKGHFPNGLPRPHSDDPAQWIFHGHPCGSVVWDETKKRTAHGPPRADSSVLQVAVARLLGYRWPSEQDPDMELAVEQRQCVARCELLRVLEDEDGIVCIPPVRGERPAAERLAELVRQAYANDWADDLPAKLLAGSRGTTLDDWLRNWFFEEHCQLFHHKPFIWHVWDGRKRDGFHALVNYHRLTDGNGKGRQLLESLAYSYLGDWIARQRDGVARDEPGSDDRLAAALELQKRLAAILDGEPPFDLFVRWKPLTEQAVGWNPDVNDSVRLNIRPFLADDIPGGKKGAGVLRSKPNVHWRKDRGKEPMRLDADFPWFWEEGRFTGERVNDVHLTIAEKRAESDASGKAAVGA